MYVSIGCFNGVTGMGISGNLAISPDQNYFAFLGVFDTSGVAPNEITACDFLGCPEIALFFNGTVTIP